MELEKQLSKVICCSSRGRGTWFYFRAIISLFLAPVLEESDDLFLPPCLPSMCLVQRYTHRQNTRTYRDGLNENGHHELIFLNVRSQIGGAIQKGLGGVGLLLVCP